MISEHDIADMVDAAPRGRLIAFVGPAGAGKTTAANAMVAEGWELIKFAAPLKEMMRTLYRFVGIPEEGIEARIEGRLKEEPDPVLLGASPRRAMQTLGTDWGRQLIRDELWISLWRARVWRALQAGQNVVVDDCRFANEAEAVGEMGGVVVGVVGRAKMIDASHPSEQIDVEPDFLIQNGGSLEELRAQIKRI